MAEQEDRWRSSPFIPNLHGRPEERIASALEYVATQIGQINRKMDYFRRKSATSERNVRSRSDCVAKVDQWAVD